MLIRFRNTFSNFYGKRMSTLRYFANPKPDYETTFGEPQIPQTELVNTISDIISRIQSHLKPIERNGGDGVYLGTAGVAYMFYHLSKVPTLKEHKHLYLHKAVEYLKPAIFAVSQTHRSKDIPSFILGNAGVYAVASAIFKAVGEQSQSDQFRDVFYDAAKICNETKFLSCGSDELFVGRAGYILGALWLARQTKTPIKKKEIYHLCKVTVQSGREYAVSHQSPCPLMYAYYQVEYLGAAHGLCSILQALLSVPGFLDTHPSEAADIKRTINFLLSLQTKEGNFPSAIDEIGYQSDLVHWCHGAGGMFYLMAKAYLIYKDDKYLKSCKLMSDLIWDKGLLKKGPGLCHGVAGNGYVFLLLHRITKEPIYLHRAIRFSQFLESEEFQKEARTPDSPYSLYEGIAGTACFLADITCPLQATFPFSDIF